MLINSSASMSSVRVLASVLAAFCFVCFANADVTGLFAFGDSLVDPGNNNYPYGNHYPYGLDLPDHRATGRFSNGKLAVDLLAEILGLNDTIPYMATTGNRPSYSWDHGSINFASAGSGIFDSTGPSSAWSLTEQVDRFEDFVSVLESSLGSEGARVYLAESIFYVCTGNNDVNNYFSSRRTSLQSFQDTQLNNLISTLKNQIWRLNSLGARKIVVVGLSAVGCIPINLHGINRQCDTVANSMATSFNAALDSALSDTTGLMDGHIVKTNFYQLMTNVHDNAQAYGFQDTRNSCCPLNGNNLNCNYGSRICRNRSAYSYWDGVHNTQAFNQLAADTWWSGTTDDVYPVNVSTLATTRFPY